MKIACLTTFASMRGVLLFTALASFAHAQNRAWIAQFGVGTQEWAVGAASDGSGGVYVSGYTGGSLGGPSAGLRDAWLARHDGAGNQLWVRQLGTSSLDSANAAAPDGSGGVYISGYCFGSLGGPSAGGYDAWLARYDGAGNQAWVRQLGTSERDEAWAAALDGSGGVYVGGYTRGSLGGPNAGGRDAWLARYDGAGNQLWVRQFGTTETERSLAAAPDGSGGVYISGYTGGHLVGSGLGNYDAWLARYDGAGNQTWIRQLGTIDGDDALAAAPDGSGGVYVIGTTAGNFGGPNAGGYDAWLARYDGAGNQAWVRQLGTSERDVAWAAAMDGSGGVYVSGYTGGSLGGPFVGVQDAWLARYDGTGNQLWVDQLGTGELDMSYAAAADGSGGVYVSGRTWGSLGGPNSGSSDDAWLARYVTDIGTRYCSPSNGNSTGQAAVLSAVGSTAVLNNHVSLIASQLPNNAFGFFLTSRSQGLVMGPGGSQGDLCLGSEIGRYVGPGQIQNSGSTGAFILALDLTLVAQPTGFVSVQPGETWNFQAWHRDANPGPTSNLTDAVSVTFQ